MKYEAEIILRTDPFEAESKEEAISQIYEDWAEQINTDNAQIVEITVNELEDIDV